MITMPRTFLRRVAVFWFGLVAGGIALWALSPGVASAQLRIAYVTSWRIIGPEAEYQGSKDAEQALNRDVESWNRELEDKKQEIVAIEKEIEQKRLIVSESKRQELEQKRAQLAGEYERRVKEVYGDGGLIERRNFELTKAVLDKVKEAVTAIAREEGYDFVFDASDANLVWANKDYDITEKVLTKMAELAGRRREQLRRPAAAADRPAADRSRRQRPPGLTGPTGPRMRAADPPLRFRLGDLAAELDGVLEGDPNVEITGVAGIRDAGPGDLTFLADLRQAPLLARTRASAVLVAGGDPAPGFPPDDRGLRSLREPAPGRRPVPRPGARGRSPESIRRAVIGPGVRLGDRRWSIGPQAVIEAAAEIGAGSVIGALTFIGHHVADRRRLPPGSGRGHPGGVRARRSGGGASGSGDRLRRIRIPLRRRGPPEDPAARPGGDRGRRRDRRRLHDRPRHLLRDPHRTRHQVRQPGARRP